MGTLKKKKAVSKTAQDRGQKVEKKEIKNDKT